MTRENSSIVFFIVTAVLSVDVEDSRGVDSSVSYELVELTSSPSADFSLNTKTKDTISYFTKGSTNGFILISYYIFIKTE